MKRDLGRKIGKNTRGKFYNQDSLKSKIVNKLYNINLKFLVISNLIAMGLYMTINSFICEDGLSGGECVKNNDNKLFLIQIAINSILLIVNLWKNGSKSLIMFSKFFSLLILTYSILGTIHSISKAGLF